MILIYELAQIGVSHAPFTHAFLHTIAHAFPDEELAFYADQSHLDAVLGQPDLVLDACLTKHAYVPPPSPPRSFWPRLIATLRLLKKTWLPVANKAPQVVFFSSEPHHIWAAKIFKMLHPKFRCHMVLHGDIHSILTPRSRNPVLRAYDFVTALGRHNNPDVRFIALETHIAKNLGQLIPSASSVIDVIRHPCMSTHTPWESAVAPDGTIRFSLLGIAGPSKGLDVFARLALHSSRNERRTPDFRLIGKIQPAARSLDLSGISGPLPFSEVWLARDLFEREVAATDYVVLPYSMGYYGLAASGVLLDVLRWRKPVIAFDTPVMRELAEAFGDIGYICASEDEMLATIDRLLRDFDPLRYQLQRTNLDAAHTSRLPATTAIAYRTLQTDQSALVQ